MKFSGENRHLRQARNRYVQPCQTDSATINRQKNERQNANASQNKKSCNATAQANAFAAHLILPNRTKLTHHPDKY